MTEKLSDAAEAAILYIRNAFVCEMMNAGSEHSKYETVTAAQLAMLREAYQAGFKAASEAPDFNADLQKVLDANAAK